jgi:hypothetical protein
LSQFCHQFLQSNFFWAMPSALALFCASINAVTLSAPLLSKSPVWVIDIVLQLSYNLVVLSGDSNHSQAV